jgi:hypothetical protein
MSIYRESSFASNYINPGLPVLIAERDLFYFVKSLCIFGSEFTVKGSKSITPLNNTFCPDKTFFRQHIPFECSKVFCI